MTVGITINNGLEAIAITDSQVSGGNRQSNSVDKLSTFSSPNYSLALFATGGECDILSVSKNLSSFKGELIGDYVNQVAISYQDRYNQSCEKWLMHQRKNMETKSSCMTNVKEKAEFIKRQTNELLNNYEVARNNSSSDFMVVGYDKKEEKIRNFNFNPVTQQEVFFDHREIGSGSDGAHLYLASKLQGIDTNRLNSEQLAFFALNSFGTSTINKGVGGTPKIASINKHGVEVYDTAKTRAMTNLSGAYLAGFNPRALTQERVIERIGDIMENSKPRYASLAKDLGLTIDTLTGLYVPYSSWQEIANTKNFSRK